MKISSFSHPLVKLPAATDLTLFLIKEELKTRKFFGTLEKAGMGDCYYQPHLDTLILASVGLDDDSDETFNRYLSIIEKRSKKIKASNNSIMKQALKVYQELLLTKETQK